MVKHGTGDARANQFFTLHNQPLGASPRFPREADASACRLIYLTWKTESPCRRRGGGETGTAWRL